MPASEAHVTNTNHHHQVSARALAFQLKDIPILVLLMSHLFVRWPCNTNPLMTQVDAAYMVAILSNATWLCSNQRHPHPRILVHHMTQHMAAIIIHRGVTCCLQCTVYAPTIRFFLTTNGALSNTYNNNNNNILLLNDADVTSISALVWPHMWTMSLTYKPNVLLVSSYGNEC